MYEPLLEVELSDAVVGHVQRPLRPPPDDARRVVIVAEVFGNLAAERNTLAILEGLLQSDQVGFIAVGDHAEEFHFNPQRSAEFQADAARARREVEAGSIRAADAAARMLLSPSVPLFGVANERSSAAATARERRLAGLRTLYRELQEPQWAFVRNLLEPLARAGFQRPLVEASRLADWPALERLFHTALGATVGAWIEEEVRRIERTASPENAWLSAVPVAVSLGAQIAGQVLHRLPAATILHLQREILDHTGLLLLSEPLDQSHLPLLARLERCLGGRKGGDDSPLLRRAETLRGTLQPLAELLTMAEQAGLDLEPYPLLRLFRRASVRPRLQTRARPALHLGKRVDIKSPRGVGRVESLRTVRRRLRLQNGLSPPAKQPGLLLRSWTGGWSMFCLRTPGLFEFTSGQSEVDDEWRGGHVSVAGYIMSKMC